MNRRLRMDLMRQLHGELPPERTRELEERLARDPALAAAHRRLEEAWLGLDLPPAAPPPPGFAARVMARTREGARDPLSWSFAPTWARATAAAALVAGLAAGAGLGGFWQAPDDVPVPATSTEELLLADSAAGSLADSYWDSVEEEGGLGDDPLIFAPEESEDLR